MSRCWDAKRSTLGLVWAACFWLVACCAIAQAETVQYTNVVVAVTDAETNQPIYQAHLTLQFREPGKAGKLKLPRRIAYNAKTDSRGRYRFTLVPMDTVRLIVTADRHQTFSKEFEVDKADQVLEVKLKKPQPLL